jgi:hypothetical protein
MLVVRRLPDTARSVRAVPTGSRWWSTLYVMSTYRYRASAALLLAPLLLAACAMGEKPSASTQPDAGDTVVSPASVETAKLGVPFRNGSFEVTVTRVETGVRQLDISDAAKSSGVKPWTPKNGRYVVVHLTARNIGNIATYCSTNDSTLVDDAGTAYGVAVLVGAPPVGQGLGGDTQPGMTGSGFLVFDVPTSAGTPATLVLNTKQHRATINPAPTVVNLHS